MYPAAHPKCLALSFLPIKGKFKHFLWSFKKTSTLLRSTLLSFAKREFLQRKASLPRPAERVEDKDEILSEPRNFNKTRWSIQYQGEFSPGSWAHTVKNEKVLPPESSEVNNKLLFRINGECLETLENINHKVWFGARNAKLRNRMTRVQSTLPSNCWRKWRSVRQRLTIPYTSRSCWG